MQKLLREYLDELNRKQKRRRKTVIAVVLAAIMLVSGVIWNLTQYGIAMTGEPKCGMEEHTHSDSCYADVLTCGREESAGHTHTETCYQTTSELVCGQEESEEHTHSDSCYQAVQTLVCGQEESAGHTHTEACYEKQLVCGKEEHTHSEACYIDTTADVEDASIWNAQYADTKWKDAWGEDLVIAAKKQIGYKESTDNYTVATDGSHKGYTRYGQFAGDVYADWDAVFVNFCMHYAGLEKTGLFPKETETAKWHEKFAKGNAGQNAAYLTDAKDYEPQIGDILFFEKEKEETDDQMGIISSYDKEKNELQVIEGNVDNAVKENKYAANDVHITAYLKISELEAAYKNDGAEAGEEETPEEEAPVAEELNYEDDQIIVKVTAAEEGIIPEGATLKVVPITKENAETEAQYQDVEAKLQEKAENEEYDIAGFLAYDISFVDADGNKLEPNGKVNVSMDYKSPELPQEVVENGAADAEVTVLHLEEDENGEVQQIVDMGAEQKATVDTLVTTEGEKVKSVELETESFSTFTITWKNSDRKAVITVHYVDEDGNGVDVTQANISTKSIEKNETYDLNRYKHDIDGYDFVKITLNEIKGPETTLLRRNNYNYIQYQSPSNTWNNWFEYEEDKETKEDIYFVYKPSGPTTSLTFEKVNSKGEKLSGAIFQLSNEVGRTYAATSDANGIVTFEKIPKGEYTLSELKAPAGYDRTLETWSVRVEEDQSGELKAILYKSGDDTSEAITEIVNYSETEMAVKNLESSKTAKVIDEDNRKFQIDLNASTSGQGGGEAAKGASIVLVLDASSSMNNDGKSLKDIKDAAKAFVDNAAVRSPLSEISVIWFNGSEGESYNTTSVQNFKSLDTGNDVNAIKDFIDNKSASGGTPMGDALEKAYGQLSLAQNSNKYVLFFTDGMPGYWSDNTSKNCKVANKAYNYAEKIKDPGDGNAVLYTVGYQLSGTLKWQPGHSGSSANDHGKHNINTSAAEFLSGYIASTGKAFTVDNKEQLLEIFKDIEGSIGEMFTIKPKRIEDVIDARFELTQKSRDKLTAINGVKVTDNPDGTTTITWTGEAAIIGNRNAENDGKVKGPWSSSFEIQAKADFIGGNMVPTNGSSSGIYLDDTAKKLFEQPSVNVRPLTLSLEDKNVWVYKGDTIGPIGYADELNQTLKITELDGVTTTNTGKPTWPTLTDEQKTELEKNGTLTINADGTAGDLKYIYTNTADAVGYFKYTYEIVNDVNNQPMGSMASHHAEKVGEEVEKYQLTVEFVPYSVEERDTLTDSVQRPSGVILSDPQIPAGGTELLTKEDKGKLTASGIYSVNVIAGEIQITKKLEEAAEMDLTFEFTVKNSEDEIIATIHITIPAGQKQASYTGDTLKNLARGTYKIEEENHTEYGVQSIGLCSKVEANGNLIEPEKQTDSEAEVRSPEYVSITLGNNVNQENVIVNGTYDSERGGVFGGVLFTNEKKISNWQIVKRNKNDVTQLLEGAEFTLTPSQIESDLKTYYGKSVEGGKVNWFEDSAYTKSVEKIEPGIYTLKETKAPENYLWSEEEWTLEILREGALKSVKDSNGDPIDYEIVGECTTFYYDNTMLYELPSAGGPGIYWYIFGGILLMAAAMLIIYKNKCKEVLRS